MSRIIWRRELHRKMWSSLSADETPFFSVDDGNLRLVREGKTAETSLWACYGTVWEGDLSGIKVDGRGKSELCKICPCYWKDRLEHGRLFSGGFCMKSSVGVLRRILDNKNIYITNEIGRVKLTSGEVNSVWYYCLSDTITAASDFWIPEEKRVEVEERRRQLDKYNIDEWGKENEDK